MHFGVLRPVAVGVGGGGGNFVFGVRDGVGQVEQEGAGFVLADEVEGEVGEEVVRVLAVAAVCVGGKREFGLVLPEVRWVVGVGFCLVEVAEPLVEALPVGHAGGAGFAQAPFAGDSGCVAGFFEDFGYSEIFGFEGQASFRADAASSGLVAADAGVAGVQAGHEDAAGRGADRGAGVALGEAAAFGGEFVYVRSLDMFLAVTAEIAVSEVIGHDENNVGFAGASSA